MGATATVVFVCPHGSAKSVIAAEHFARLARARGLAIDGLSAGIEPDAEIPAAVVSGLLADGIDVRSRRPRAATRQALARASRAVAFGCDLGGLAPPDLPIHRWDDIPAVSQDFQLARDRIVARLPGLLAECESARGPGARGDGGVTVRATGARRLGLGVVLLGLIGAMAGLPSRPGRPDRPWIGLSPGTATAAPLELPAGLPPARFDFEQQDIGGWKVVGGRWSVEPMSGAPSGQRVLVQRAVASEFNVIVAPGGPYTDVDASVRFQPISGRQDASGGIVFRFHEGRYYVVRANALEGNFRLYYYDRGRHQLASARTAPPVLGRWHALRVVAVGDRIQAYLDGRLLLDHRDGRYRAGQVGLWTKADSITAFDDLEIRGVATGG